MSFKEALKILGRRYEYLKDSETNYAVAERTAIKTLVAKALAVDELGYDSVKQLTAEQVLNSYGKLYSPQERVQKKRFHKELRCNSGL